MGLGLVQIQDGLSLEMWPICLFCRDSLPSTRINTAKLNMGAILNIMLALRISSRLIERAAKAAYPL